jgi:hypothetical protein
MLQLPDMSPQLPLPPPPPLLELQPISAANASAPVLDRHAADVFMLVSRDLSAANSVTTSVQSTSANSRRAGALI